MLAKPTFTIEYGILVIAEECSNGQGDCGLISQAIFIALGIDPTKVRAADDVDLSLEQIIANVLDPRYIGVIVSGRNAGPKVRAAIETARAVGKPLLVIEPITQAGDEGFSQLHPFLTKLIDLALSMSRAAIKDHLP